jgi:hypothetical protein
MRVSGKFNQGIDSAEKFRCWSNPSQYLRFGGFDKFERTSLTYEKKARALLTTCDMSTPHPTEDKMKTAAEYTLKREEYRDPANEPVFGCRPASNPMFGRFQTNFNHGEAYTRCIFLSIKCL